MRYLPLTEKDRQEMLAAIGVAHADDLFADVPEIARSPDFSDLPTKAGEFEVERAMTALAAKNTHAGAVPFFIGGGAYRHHVPATVDHLIQRSEFLTSYTPYQPEISQGTLQYLFEFQTQVALLTGMDVANASMYDGSTACAEAVQMAMRITKRNKVVLSGRLHPQYADVVRTALSMVPHALEVGAAEVTPTGSLEDKIDGETACVVVQNPDFFGNIEDLSSLCQKAHEQGALVIVAFTEVVSLAALKSPGAMGADIVVGEGQSIGNGLNFGGPYVGLFATRKKYLRQMPGRLCGETVDANGRRGYVLTLSTREQHIRREKATSNICTNSGLCALAFTIHLTLLGEKGVRDLATLNHQEAVKTADALTALEGVELATPFFFNEFSVHLPKPAKPVVDALGRKGILAGLPAARLLPGAKGLENVLIVAATELTTDADRAALVSGLKEVLV